MKTRSKRFQLLKSYTSTLPLSLNIDSATSILKKLAIAKFSETFEAHITLNIDPRKPNQQLCSNLTLPHNFIKNKKIAVLTSESNIDYALSLGVSIAGCDDLLKKISQNKFDFDILIATWEISDKLLKVSHILGRRGLMPSPKFGTLTKNLQKTISEYDKGKIEYKSDKNGIVHISFGKSNLSNDELKENLIAIYNSLHKNKPIGLRGKYIKSFYICSTMSPSLNININSFNT